MIAICDMVMDEGMRLKDRELSTLIPMYKGEGDPLDCGSCWALRLFEHAMKVLERVLERRLREYILTEYNFDLCLD